MKPWSIFRCVAVFVCCAAGLRAQNSTWTGLGLTDTEWSDPLNWDVVPGTTSNVFFSNLTPVVSDIDTNTTVSNVFIEGSVLGTLDLTSTNHSTLNASIYYETTQAAAISVAVTQNPGAVFAVNGGVLTLSNANNILSNVLILSGTLVDGVQGSCSGTEGVSIDAPGILHVQYNESAGYLSDNTTGGGSVVLDPGVTLTLANNYTTTFSGVISGSGGIEKGANSTMTLTGANTYTGATVIDTGATIQLGNGGTTGSLSPFTTVSGGGTLSFSLASTTPLQETLSGSLNVVLQAGSGTVQLAGPNSYSGTTTVNAGILQAGSSTAFGNGFSAVSIPGSGALDLNGWDNAIGTLNLSATGSVTLDAGTLTIDSPGGTSFINGVISGSNGRVTTNSYQVIVTSENTYTGQTTIGGGTFEADNPSGGYANGQGSAQVLITPTGILQIGSGNANGFINPASPIIDNGTVTFVRADDITFSNNISGSGGLVKIATSDTVTLSGSNSFSGPIDLYSGTLKAGAGDTSAFGAGSEVKFDSSSSVLDLNNNAESVGSIYNGNASDSISLGSGHLTLTDNSASTNFAGIIQGTGGVTTSESQLALLGASTYSGGTIVLAGSLVADNAAGSATGTGDITILGGASLQIGSNDTKGAVSASTIMDAGTVVFDRTDSTTFSSNITGPGGILLSSPSPGSVELNGNNNYTGATDIENGGTLYAGSSSAFGSGSSDLTINNGGILVMSGHDLAFESITGDTSGQIQTGGAMLSVGSSNTDMNFGGTISGTGGLLKEGSGTLTLSGFNNYTGTTIVQQGLLADGQANAFSADSPIYIGNSLSGGLTVNYDETIPSVVDFGGVPGTITLNDGATLTFTATTSTNSAIGGAGGVTVDIMGSTLSLGGGNTYFGDTVVNQGTLQDNAGNSFSPNSSVYVNSGAALVANFNETVGNLESTSAGGTVSISGPFNSLGMNYQHDFQGVISGAGEFVEDGGIQGLSGNNTYTGGTLVTGQGELFVGSDNALGTGTVVFNVDTEFSPDADVTMSNPIILSNHENLENDDGLNFNMTLTGVISESGGAGSIEWCTTGTLTLMNANTFTGGVDMRLGNLVLGNNTAAGTGTITLDAGTSLNVMSGVTTSNALNFTGLASLTGSGTIATTVVADSSVIIAPVASPGNGPGTLTFSTGLTLASGTEINFSIFDASGVAGTGYSLISATGGLTLTAPANSITFDISSVDSSGHAAQAINFSGGAPYSWTFATSTSAISGFNPNEFNIVASGFQNSIGAGIFSVSEVGNNLELNFTPVPEPSTWCLIGVGLLAVVPFALRRRRAAT